MSQELEFKRFRIDTDHGAKFGVTVVIDDVIYGQDTFVCSELLDGQQHPDSHDVIYKTIEKYLRWTISNKLGHPV